MPQEVLNGQLNEQQLADLKKKFETIHAFKTDYGIAYFRKPDRLTLKSATDAVQQGVSEFNDVIAANCFITGDKSILEDPEYFSELNKLMNKLAEGKKAEIVKL